jgi:hypothetical protein
MNAKNWQLLFLASLLLMTACGSGGKLSAPAGENTSTPKLVELFVECRRDKERKWQIQ